MLLAENRKPLDKLSNKLDTGETTTGNDEREHLFSKLLIFLVCCGSDSLLNVVLDSECVAQTPEEERMFLDSWNIEVGRFRPSGDDQLIVWVVCSCPFEYLFLEVDLLDLVANHIHHLAGKDTVE